MSWRSLVYMQTNYGAAGAHSPSRQAVGPSFGAVLVSVLKCTVIPRRGESLHTRPVLQYCFSFDPEQADATRPSTLSNTGWALELEHNGKLKPGLRATSVGAELWIRLPLGSAGQTVSEGTLDVTFLVSSHLRLGSALFNCAFPCTCDEQRISAFSRDAYQVTLNRIAHIPFRTIEDHERANQSSTTRIIDPSAGCELRIRALEGDVSSSEDEGQGFKLMGLGATVFSFLHIGSDPRMSSSSI